MIQTIKTELEYARDTLDRLATDEATLQTIAAAAQLCIDALKSGGKVLFAGNGGSAADSQHMAGEFVSRFNYDRPGLAGIALTTDTSILTAIGNDYGYEHLFARQVQALGRAGDVLIGISTSGSSPNILRAFQEARALDIKTIGLTGMRGVAMSAHCDCCIIAPTQQTPRVQEAHIAIGHIICGLIETAMFPRS